MAKHAARDSSGVLLGKETFGDDVVEIDVQRDGQKRDDQHQWLMTEHPVEGMDVAIVQPIESTLPGIVKASMLTALLRAQEPSTHHGCGGE